MPFWALRAPCPGTCPPDQGVAGHSGRAVCYCSSPSRSSTFRNAAWGHSGGGANESRKRETPFPPGAPLTRPSYPRVTGRKMEALGGGEDGGARWSPLGGLGVQAGGPVPHYHIVSLPWFLSICYSLSKRSLAVTGTWLAGPEVCALRPWLPRLKRIHNEESCKGRGPGWVAGGPGRCPRKTPSGNSVMCNQKRSPREVTAGARGGWGVFAGRSPGSTFSRLPSSLLCA